MLSVFITPWQKPTACHCATMAAVRSLTCSRNAAYGVAGERLGPAAFGVVPVDDVVGELAQLVVLLARREVLEMPEADEAGCDARDHRGGLDFLAPHGRLRAGDHEGASGGYAQPVHRLGPQEFADAGPQHGAPVAHARVGGAAAALELELLRAGGGLRLAQKNGPSIAQLPRPHAELVAAVDAGQRAGAGQWQIAGESLHAFGPGKQFGGQAQFGGKAPVQPDQVGGGQGLRRQLGIERRPQPGEAVGPGQVQVELARRGVDELIHGLDCPWSCGGLRDKGHLRC